MMTLMTRRRGCGALLLRRPVSILPRSIARPQPAALARTPARRHVATRFLPSDHEQHGATSTATFTLVCPACHQQRFTVTRDPDRDEALPCRHCGHEYAARADGYLDLVLAPRGHQPPEQRAPPPQPRRFLVTELFRSPVVSWLYERGWRQAFALAGFPGVEAEFDMAMDYLRPAYGQVLVDMSCGSGLFTWRFARSGAFQGVVAADFSESMLKQARGYLQEDRGKQDAAGACPVLLLRADVGRLPFATGSVAGIHAGAAIHCWPNPQAALAEISRVLAPGGVFVASAFMRLDVDEALPVNPDAALLARPHLWWTEFELRRICAGVGLRDFRRVRHRRFILFCAAKPRLIPEPPQSS